MFKNDEKSPCMKCEIGWSKGCRNGCQAYEEFERKKQERYKAMYERIKKRDVYAEYMRCKKYRGESTAASRHRREIYENGNEN